MNLLGRHGGGQQEEIAAPDALRLEQVVLDLVASPAEHLHAGLGRLGVRLVLVVAVQKARRPDMRKRRPQGEEVAFGVPDVAARQVVHEGPCKEAAGWMLQGVRPLLQDAFVRLVLDVQDCSDLLSQQ